MSSQNDKLYSKWRNWFEVLNDEILNLFEQRYIYNEVQNIIKANEEIHSPADFNFWMSIWYSSSMSVAVRKLADKDEKACSYRRLLERIKKNPYVISRTRFKKNFVRGSFLETDADECFDKLVGVGSEYLDLIKIEEEINRLEDAIEIVKKYVDKRIAHHEDKANIPIPRFEDLNSAIDFYGNLHQRYHIIFTGNSLPDLLSEWLYDWKEVFHYPWVK